MFGGYPESLSPAQYTEAMNHAQRLVRIAEACESTELLAAATDAKSAIRGMFQSIGYVEDWDAKTDTCTVHP